MKALRDGIGDVRQARHIDFQFLLHFLKWLDYLPEKVTKTELKFYLTWFDLVNLPLQFGQNRISNS